MLSVSIRDLRHDPQSQIPVEAVWEVPCVKAGYETYTCLKPWVIRGNVSRVGTDDFGQEIYEFSGTVDTALRMRCARCLKRVDEPLHVEVRQRFVLGEETTMETEDYDLDYLPISSDIIELDDVIRYDVLLAVPMKVLCKPDCKGLCPTCGKDLNDGPCLCQKDDTDPRWDGLKQFY